MRTQKRQYASSGRRYRKTHDGEHAAQLMGRINSLITELHERKSAMMERAGGAQHPGGGQRSKGSTKGCDRLRPSISTISSDGSSSSTISSDGFSSEGCDRIRPCADAPEPTPSRSVAPFEGSGTVITTLMLCDIPYQVSLEKLIAAIDELGFEGTYDVVCMPCSRWTRPKARPCQGYAFVNFKRSESVEPFASAFRDYAFPVSGPPKPCSTKVAACQGYENTLTMHKKKQSTLLTFHD